jgi:hypothetical protein
MHIFFPGWFEQIIYSQIIYSPDSLISSVEFYDKIIGRLSFSDQATANFFENLIKDFRLKEIFLTVGDYQHLLTIHNKASFAFESRLATAPDYINIEEIRLNYELI